MQDTLFQYAREQETSTSREPSRLGSEWPEMLGVKEAAGVLRVSRSTMYELIKTGRIPAVRLGRRIFIDRNDLRRVIEEAKVRGPG